MPGVDPGFLYVADIPIEYHHVGAREHRFGA